MKRADSIRKHLFTDIQPYTCFYSNCTFSVTPFVDRQLWSKHLELDHKFGPDWGAIECPLCLEVTGSGKSTNLTHFARQMEDIALAALPRDVESDAESKAKSDGSLVSSTGTTINLEDTMQWNLRHICQLCDEVANGV